MEHRVLRVPIALLQDPDLTASVKVIWMARRLNPESTAAQVEALTGISRKTVLVGLGQLASKRRYPATPYVLLPEALLSQRHLNARAKLLYGLLQTLSSFRSERGEFTYTELCDQTGLSRNTLKQALAELVAARWIRASPADRRGALRFSLGHPHTEQSLAEAATADRRLKRAKFRGEAIMKEYLSLLIDSDQFTDNARPGFLINPLTDQPLELDRFYPPKVAFEYHGSQHDEPDGKFSPEEVKAQQIRDYIKAGICLYRGITLLIIRAEDLSLERMDERIGRLLPRRDLTGHEPLIDLLERSSIVYQANSPRRG